MKDSLYEEILNFIAKTARLRKKLEQLESSLGIDRLRLILKRDQKQLRREEKLKRKLTVITASGRMLSLNYALKVTLSSS